MAIRTNTTKTVKLASTALGAKVEQTIKDMDTRLRAAGVKGAIRRVRVPIDRGTDAKDDVIFIGLNGQKFYFMRGMYVDMPLALLEIAVNAGYVDRIHLEEAKKTTMKE